jgi:hypothetical protein
MSGIPFEFRPRAYRSVPGIGRASAHISALAIASMPTMIDMAKEQRAGDDRQQDHPVEVAHLLDGLDLEVKLRLDLRHLKDMAQAGGRVRRSGSGAGR